MNKTGAALFIDLENPMANTDSLATMQQVLKSLREQGYTDDFNLQTDCLRSSQKQMNLQPEDFEIDRTYRFEGATDPSDEAIIYAISAKKSDSKGVLINSYGVYADPLTANLAKKLEISGREKT